VAAGKLLVTKWLDIKLLIINELTVCLGCEFLACKVQDTSLYNHFTKREREVRQVGVRYLPVDGAELVALRLIAADKLEVHT
jgi:hypothetical protein